MRTRRVCASLVLLLILAALAETGCIASKVTVSEAGGDPHKVKVGGEVVVVLPASRQTREWQLTRVDPIVLPMTMEPRLVSTGTNAEWIARFEPRKPGTAEIEFTRVAVGADLEARVGQRRRYRFDIRR
jgi:hypothetical protein